MNTKISYFVCGVLLVLMSIGVESVSASGSTIVQWYGDYLSGGDDLKGKGKRWYRGHNSDITKVFDIDIDGDNNTDDDSILYYEYSLDTPLTPLADGVSGGRYLTDAPSALFYGGVTVYFADYKPNLLTQATIEDSGRNPLVFDSAFPSNRPWRARALTPVPDEGFWSEMTLFVWDGIHVSDGGTRDDDLAAFDAVYIWKKEDFLNGGSDRQVSFDETSRLAVDVTRRWDGPLTGRFVVQDEDQLYVSQATVDDGGRQFGQTNEVIPTETLWAPYNPSGLYDIDFDQDLAVFAAHDFLDVQAVGLYIEQDDLLHVKQGFVFDNFDIQATVVPTPTSLALLGIGVGVVFSSRRRRSGV